MAGNAGYSSQVVSVPMQGIAWFHLKFLFDLGVSGYLIPTSSFFTKTLYSEKLKLKSGIHKTFSVIKKCVYFFEYYILKCFYTVLEFWTLDHWM